MNWFQLDLFKTNLAIAFKLHSLIPYIKTVLGILYGVLRSPQTTPSTGSNKEMDLSQSVLGDHCYQAINK